MEKGSNILGSMPDMSKIIGQLMSETACQTGSIILNYARWQIVYKDQPKYRKDYQSQPNFKKAYQHLQRSN